MKSLDDYVHDFYERAGIVEYDGKSPRDEAEHTALVQVVSEALAQHNPPREK